MFKTIFTVDINVYITIFFIYHKKNKIKSRNCYILNESLISIKMCSD